MLCVTDRPRATGQSVARHRLYAVMGATGTSQLRRVPSATWAAGVVMVVGKLGGTEVQSR
jgi:hypothetical protein